jgi:hypothetical protein
MEMTMTDFQIWYRPPLPNPLSREQIARGWPHQVIVRAHLCTGHQFYQQER